MPEDKKAEYSSYLDTMEGGLNSQENKVQAELAEIQKKLKFLATLRELEKSLKEDGLLSDEEIDKIIQNRFRNKYSEASIIKSEGMSVNMKVTDLPLSNRIIECFRIEGFKTLNDVLKSSKLEKIPNLGRKSLKSFKRFLDANGFEYSDTLFEI